MSGEPDRLPDMRNAGWVDRTEQGHGVAALEYPDGTIGIEHVCCGRGGGDRLVAPMLTIPGHVIVSRTPLTITPSILCPDCGLHGFITDGTWRA